MGFPLENWDAALTDVAMFIGGTGGTVWWTGIAAIMLIGIIIAGNSSEQQKYKDHQ